VLALHRRVIGGVFRSLLSLHRDLRSPNPSPHHGGCAAERATPWRAKANPIAVQRHAA
jgi:hypothetical protein